MSEQTQSVTPEQDVQSKLLGYLAGFVNGITYLNSEETPSKEQVVAVASTTETMFDAGLLETTLIEHLASGQRKIKDMEKSLEEASEEQAVALKDDILSVQKSWITTHEGYFAYCTVVYQEEGNELADTDESAEAYNDWFMARIKTLVAGN